MRRRMTLLALVLLLTVLFGVRIFGARASMTVVPVGLAVTASQDGSRVIVEGRWGDAPGEFGSELPEQGDPCGPLVFTVGSVGNVYMLDQVNGRVQVFSGEGSFLRLFPIAPTADDMAVDDKENVWVLDQWQTRRVTTTSTTMGREQPGRLKWTPRFNSAGYYDVYAPYTSASDRASNAWYEVKHRNGTSAITIDQRSGGGTWVYLGRFVFNAGYDMNSGAVNLVAKDGAYQANGYVIADAVRFVWYNTLQGAGQ